MSSRPLVHVALVLGLVAAVPPLAAGDVIYETAVRITDSLGAGTAEINQTVRTSVTATARREDVTGSRRMTTRRGRQYDRPGRYARIELLDGAAVYDLDLDAGIYTRSSFAEVARERERTLAEAEAAFRGVTADAPVDRPVTITRASERVTVNGVACSPILLETFREAGAGPNGEAPTAARGRFAMSLELCMADDAESGGVVRATEERVRELMGDSDAYLARLLDVLARRRDLFAVFDDLHYRLERERRNLGGLPVRWVQHMTGPQRGSADAVLFRLEATVKTLHVGPVEASEFTVPASLRLAERRREQ